MTSYQFKSPSFQESPVQVATIGNVDVAHRNASATMLNGGGNVVINLSAFNGPVLVWPNPGEQWYIKLLKGQWVLAERNSISAQAYLVDAEPGDQVWDVQGNLTTVVTEIFSLTDSNGSLTTIPTPVWTPVTFQNGWTNESSGYPAAEYLVHNGLVRFRGGIKPGTTTDATTVFTIPSIYCQQQGVQIFPVANGGGTPATSSLRLSVNINGACNIYGIGTVAIVDVSSVSFYYLS